MDTKDKEVWQQPVWINTAHIPEVHSIDTTDGTVTITFEPVQAPSGLDRYIIGNNVELRIVDILGGYRFELLIDNLIVWCTTTHGGLMNGAKVLQFSLPITAAIHEEEVTGVQDNSSEDIPF